MKVLHVIDSGGLYGAEVMLLNLVSEQTKLGLEPHIASIGEKNCGEKALEAEARRLRIAVKKFRMIPGPNIFGALGILRYARTDKFHLMHSHGYKGNILFGLMPKKIRQLPLVSTLHGYTSTARLTKMKIYEWLDTKSLKHIDAVVIVNQGMLSNPKLRCVNGVNFRTINNGIPFIENGFNSAAGPVGFSQPEDKNIADFCANSFAIGAIGRLSLEKAFDRLIMALRLVTDEGIDAKLVIIGEGNQRKSLEGLIEKLGLSDRIILPGYRKDAKRFLPCFDVFVISSLTEGLPITLLEAMQARVPVVATKVGGIAEVLENGKAGFLIDPDDSNALASVLSNIYHDRYLLGSTIELAYKRVKDIFNSQTMAKKYLSLYQELLYAFTSA